MDSLNRLGISCHLIKSELLLALSSLSNQSLLEIRQALFADTIKSELAPDNRAMVTRSSTAANPLPTKLAEDIWTLLNCIKHKKTVPRTILKNGKRDRVTFKNSQLSLIDADQVTSHSLSDPYAPEQSSPLTETATPGAPDVSHSNFATSTLMKEMNIIKNEVRSLRSSINLLSVTCSSDSALRDEVSNLRQALTSLYN